MDERIVDVVVKLNMLTQESKIIWVSYDIKNGTQVFFQPITQYKTQYKERWFRLSHTPQSAAKSAWEATMYTGNPTLEIIDNYDNVLWIFPNLAVINDLWHTVHGGGYDVHKLLDDFLNEDF